MPRNRLFLLGAGLLCFACDSPTAPGSEMPTRVNPDWVVGAAASAVDPVSGLFLLTPRYDTELDAATARSLAAAYLSLTANEGPVGNTRLVAEQDRGTEINWSSLQPCGRTYVASSSLGPHPETVPRVYHRLNAAQWVVSFCGPRDVELSIGVSDAPTSLSIVNGTLVWDHPDSLAGVFTVTGVPKAFPSGIPLTPEDAVSFAFAMTRTRVAEPPEAFDQLGPGGIGQLPLCASWRLVFEDPVPVVPESGGPVEVVNELYVRHEPACFSTTIALYAADSPADENVWVRYLTGLPNSPSTDSVLVRALGPSRFHRVIAVR